MAGKALIGRWAKESLRYDDDWGCVMTLYRLVLRFCAVVKERVC
jgi:hypothetical protein